MLRSMAGIGWNCKQEINKSRCRVNIWPRKIGHWQKILCAHGMDRAIKCRGPVGNCTIIRINVNAWSWSFKTLVCDTRAWSYCYLITGQVSPLLIIAITQLSQLMTMVKSSLNRWNKLAKVQLICYPSIGKKRSHRRTPHHEIYSIRGRGSGPER